MDGACRPRERAPGRYTPRRPSQSILYRRVQEHLASNEQMQSASRATPRSSRYPFRTSRSLGVGVGINRTP